MIHYINESFALFFWLGMFSVDSLVLGSEQWLHCMWSCTYDLICQLTKLTILFSEVEFLVEAASLNQFFQSGKKALSSLFKILHEITFCMLFLLKRNTYFLNNTSQDLNRSAAEVNRGALHLKESFLYFWDLVFLMLAWQSFYLFKQTDLMTVVDIISESSGCVDNERYESWDLQYVSYHPYMVMSSTCWTLSWSVRLFLTCVWWERCLLQASENLS